VETTNSDDHPHVVPFRTVQNSVQKTSMRARFRPKRKDMVDTRASHIQLLYVSMSPQKRSSSRDNRTRAYAHEYTPARTQSISHLSRLLSPGCDRRWRWPGICFWSDCAIWNAISSEISIATWTGTWIETWSEIWTWTWNAS